MELRHSVRLDRDKCMGCTNCIKRCPTEAIRVRDGKARIAELRCLDCGECIRACPHHAKSATTDSYDRLGDFAYTVALAAPSLYAQFGPPATRAMILAALRNTGFDDVREVAEGAEAVTAATLAELRKPGADTALPLISSACPVVVRLVQMRFPGLIANLVPFDSPMEATATVARRDAAAATGLATDRIGVFFISPCPAKRTAAHQPYGRERTDVDGVIAITDAYPRILSSLEKMDPSIVQDFAARHLAGRDGIRWGNIGGESLALGTDRFLAVDGIHSVIDILEEVENERLRDVVFIEANSCIGGCIGGPLTVANRFTARTRLKRSIDEAASARPTRAEEDEAAAVLRWTVPLLPNHALMLDEDMETSLRKYEAMETLLKGLPGLDCGACGAPDCSALAEDIALGEATESDCIVKLKELYKSIVLPAHAMDAADAVDAAGPARPDAAPAGDRS